ncbi:MAG: helix-turn-helix domain-containing protein [Ruminococcaceae bacterium]|nr:helix-turn-helix domain-containing protein [Oscillospiraceae bacterium]
MGFAENLREIRTRRNITQEQLAEMLSVSRQTISKWESGQGYPETEKLLFLAKELRVSLDDLFSERRMARSVPSQRISKVDTYLNCAEVFAHRSTCLKRWYGAVIVKDDAVISTGYNGAPRGMEHCSDLGVCPRMDRNLHMGEGYGICRAIHAEANALLNCSRDQTMGADLYLVGVNPRDRSIHAAKPCPVCARMIIQAGIRQVYLRVGEGAGNYMRIPAKELPWVQNAEGASL